MSISRRDAMFWFHSSEVWLCHLVEFIVRNLDENFMVYRVCAPHLRTVNAQPMADRLKKAATKHLIVPHHWKLNGKHISHYQLTHRLFRYHWVNFKWFSLHTYSHFGSIFVQHSSNSNCVQQKFSSVDRVICGR